MNITKKQKLVLDAIKRCPAAANDEALRRLIHDRDKNYDIMST